MYAKTSNNQRPGKILFAIQQNQITSVRIIYFTIRKLDEGQSKVYVPVKIRERLYQEIDVPNNAAAVTKLCWMFLLIRYFE